MELDRNERNAALREAVAAVLPDMRRVGRYLFEHPELSGEEYGSARYLAEELAKLGFTVRHPYAGVETALRADLVCGEGPTVAFLAEYDALPGYGPEHDRPAHACGHNWIAATCYGACAALARCRELFSGTVSFIGAPAEETTGGKVDVLRGGGYEGVDAAMQFHLGNHTKMDVHSLAMDSLEFTFHGKAAHASSQPFMGVNALDAVMLTHAGIGCLRQHLTTDVRIHGIVTDGGKACNVIPDLARCRYYVRAASRERLEEVKEKVLNVARGAALMTGARLEWRYFENSLDDLVLHPPLQAAMCENLAALGVQDERGPNCGKADIGSSDIGNVSRATAVSYIVLATGLGPDVAAHMEGFLEGVVGEHADRTMPIAAAAMGMTALDVYHDPSLARRA